MGGKFLTFTTATWPVESAVVKAGLSPSVLIVSIALDRAPSSPMANDWRAPIGEISLIALQRPN